MVFLYHYSKHIDAQRQRIRRLCHDTHKHPDADALGRIILRIDKAGAFFRVERFLVVVDAHKDVFTFMHNMNLDRMFLFIRFTTVYSDSEAEFCKRERRIISLLSPLPRSLQKF